MTAVALKDVDVTGGFWKEKQDINRTATIPSTYNELKRSGRIDCFKPEYKGFRHVFFDSDTAKWVETACYSLEKIPDPDLEKIVEDVIALIVNTQADDGYLNSYFTHVEPDKRWTNIRDRHELYCAGHLMEAAVAHYHATGKKHFIDALSRYADYIDTVFGAGAGKLHGYPGHEELELALAKLHAATGNERYKNMLGYFVEERGQLPYFFVLESEKRGEPSPDFLAIMQKMKYWQAHAPVRDQEEAVGHAVRAGYFYSGVADAADLFGDKTLLEACEQLWDDIYFKKFYVTGGVGARYEGEAFGNAYELPNESAYAETCAAIAFVFFSHRMLQMTGQGKYADAIERCIYNGTISGVSLDGKRFFYINPLAFIERPEAAGPRPWHASNKRPEWFGCSCCPNNISRLIAAIGTYAYSQASDGLFIHQFIGSKAKLHVKGNMIAVEQATNYPWEGTVRIVVRPSKQDDFPVHVRVPGWCNDFRLSINGTPVDATLASGYITIIRSWSAGDEIKLELDMPIQRLYSHPRVDANLNRVALQRGPVVYCLESVDNGKDLDGLILPKDAGLTYAFEPALLGGVGTIKGPARRFSSSEWKDKLYSTQSFVTFPAEIKAIPYFAWANREPGEMIVWIRES